MNFCPGCGGSIDQVQAGGKPVTCMHCGRLVGVATEGPKKVVVDQTDEQILGGNIARCPSCQQVVQLKIAGWEKTFVPHYTPGQKKMCPSSGKQPPTAPVATLAPPAAPAASQASIPPPSASPSPFPTVKTPGGRDLSKYYSKELIRVVACSKGQDPTIEELSLQYLDKSDRVRTQIEALRDILGQTFRMKDYPPALGRPHLALWNHATGCVIAKKHPQGGYQPTTDQELIEVVGDIRQHPLAFFG